MDGAANDEPVHNPGNHGACSQQGRACARNAECCSGACARGTCRVGAASGPPEAGDREAPRGGGGCLARGKPCKRDGQCCSRTCNGGRCRLRRSAPGDNPPGNPGTDPPTNDAADRVLVARYDVRPPSGTPGWSTIVYRPRQFARGLVVDDPLHGRLTVDDPASYLGWDFFSGYNASVSLRSTRPDWLELQLNRKAMLAVVWRAGTPVPRWLADWSEGEPVVVAGRSCPTFRKAFPAGPAPLGSVYDPGDNPTSNRTTYWVLLAEANDQPSPEPAVQNGRSKPQPNETCPSWVHDQYTTTGPDGRTYATWHPQIDPVYWCYHRHEHGSDPAHFDRDHRPLFGYSAAAHGMDEPHQGFKNIVVDDDAGNVWMITQHFGTAGLARACNRFHTVDIAVRRRSDGELLADIHLMGDFGKAVVNATDQPLTPPTCPNQADEAKESFGVRKLPVKSEGGTGYEPWRVDFAGNILGLQDSFTINNPDAIVICNTPTCNAPVTTGSSGSFRFFTPNNRFGIVAGTNKGVFFTDVSGKKLMREGEPGAVRQFVKPGLSLQTLIAGGGNGHYYDVHGWGLPYVYSKTGSGPANREGSLQAPN